MRKTTSSGQWGGRTSGRSSNSRLAGRPQILDHRLGGAKGELGHPLVIAEKSLSPRLVCSARRLSCLGRPHKLATTIDVCPSLPVHLSVCHFQDGWKAAHA